MSDIKFSAYLERLIMLARQVGSKPSQKVTSERLIVAVLERAKRFPNEAYTDEMRRVDEIVNSEFSAPNDAVRQKLLKYIDSSEPKTLDEARFESCINAAYNIAATDLNNEVVVSAEHVLRVIFADCSEAVQETKKIDSEGFEPIDNDELKEALDNFRNMFLTDEPKDEPEKSEEQKADKPSVEDEFAAALNAFRASNPSGEELKKPKEPKAPEAKKEPESSAMEDEFAAMLSRFKNAEASESTEAAKSEEKTEDKSDIKAEIAALVNEVKSIRRQLSDRVFGQENAINIFATGYFQACLSSVIGNERNRPKATFLFAGPPGVGKTFLAENIAELLNLPFARFDMSEYSDKEASIEFCGSDKVYKNGKSGNVTSFVADNPKCVLLFDEIEKAHLTVIHLFLQMLDAGRLRDNYTDKEVSFKDAVLIFTTNAGKQLYEDSDSGDFSGVPRKVIIKALQKDINPVTEAPFFPAAICSRFASGNVAMFNHIGAANLRAIAKREIEGEATKLEAKSGIKIDIDDRVYTALLFSEGASVDARTVRSRAESFFNDELYELLRLVASKNVSTEITELKSLKIGVDLAGVKTEVTSLFELGETPKVIVFASDEQCRICNEKLAGYEVLAANDSDTAIDAIKNNDIGFVMIDMRCGASEQSQTRLNIEDIDSPARSFFKFLRESKSDVPVYLLENENTVLSDEEKVSFMRQGVRGVLNAYDGDFAGSVAVITTALHQQASMIKLARENKLVSFETSQSVSADGTSAEITLYDLKMAVAVDSEDSENVLSSVSRPKVKLSEVIGAEDAKKELAYFIEYLKNPKKYLGTGVKAPKGVLLYGPPGTGKTMLAKAVASESDVTFIVADGNQFLKKYIGEGPEKVHELFRIARKYAPSILFIDEIDAIAKERRGSSASGGGVEETLTAFLTEMDGFSSDPSKPVFVLAATNFDVEPGRDKSLDPALMRRFDRRVYIELPTKDDRICFMKNKISSNKAFDITAEQIDNIAMRSTGMSLAALDSAMELALRSAIRENSVKVTDAILEEAFETFNNGDAKKWDKTLLERVARHESGHAFLCYESGETPSYLTVVARGNHGGYMQHADNEGKAIYTKDELLKRIRTSLGGRAAEIVYYGDEDGVSTGASGDLASATQLAQQMVCAYGMNCDFGLAVVSANAVSGEVSREVRACVNKIIAEQMSEAIRIIRENKVKIDALVNELIINNHLNSDKIEAILRD